MVRHDSAIGSMPRVSRDTKPPSPAADLDGGYWVKSVTVKSAVFKDYFILPHSAMYITVCDN